jgi:hypothetical protein
MKPLTSKQLQRIEKKKKKMSAHLEIAKLNDKDREVNEILTSLVYRCASSFTHV